MKHLLIVIFLSTQLIATAHANEEIPMNDQTIIELVKWRAKADIEDAAMISAVDGILPDLKTLPGFVSQTLYKDDEGYWVDLYRWETREQGVASNDLMAPRPSFQALIDLIDQTSVSIEFLSLPENSR